MRWTTMCGALLWACGSGGAAIPEATGETTSGGDADRVAHAVPPEAQEPTIECASGPARTAETRWVRGLRDRGSGISTSVTHGDTWLPEVEGIEAAFAAVTPEDTVVRHRGEIRFLDLRDEENWALLAQIRSAVTVLVPTQLLDDPARAASLHALSACQDVLVQAEWNDASDVEGLRTLTHIVGLQIASTADTRGPTIRSEQMRRLAGLRDLRLLAFTNVGNYIEDWIAQFVHLRTFFRGTCSVCDYLNDEGLGHIAALPRIESVSARGFALTDAGVAHFANAPNLRTLHLFGDGLTRAAVEAVGNPPNLEVLYLYSSSEEEQEPLRANLQAWIDAHPPADP